MAPGVKILFLADSEKAVVTVVVKRTVPSRVVNASKGEREQ